jgi:hypothetical protein
MKDKQCFTNVKTASIPSQPIHKTTQQHPFFVFLDVSRVRSLLLLLTLSSTFATSRSDFSMYALARAQFPRPYVRRLARKPLVRGANGGQTPTRFVEQTATHLESYRVNSCIKARQSTIETKR